MSTVSTLRHPADGTSGESEGCEETEATSGAAAAACSVQTETAADVFSDRSTAASCALATSVASRSASVRQPDASQFSESSAGQSQKRRDLNAMLADGGAYSVMVGIGENYLPAFALAMGMGQIVAGLIACVPLLAGAMLQLVSPYGVRRLGSYRRWVSLCAAIQAGSFLPLAVAAWFEQIPVALLFLLAGVYWGAGMSAGPAWSAWATSIVPARVRSRFFACRTRVSQAGVLVGFVGGGMALQYGSSEGRLLPTFAIIFLVAAICRFASSRLLAMQSEPVPRAGDMQIVGRREILARLRTNGEGRLLFYLWMMYAAAQIAGPYFTPFILGHLRYDYATYMLILATSILTKSLSMPLLGRFAQRYGSRRLMIMGGLLMVPLPLFWLLSVSVPYLLCVQVIAGFAWAAYELAIILMSFDCIPASHRTSMLTAYNFGYAVVSVAGSLVGGLLLKLGGETYAAYLVVFAVSAAGRVLTLPLLRRLPYKNDERPAQDRAIEIGARDTGIALALQGTSRPPSTQPAVAP